MTLAERLDLGRELRKEMISLSKDASTNLPIRICDRAVEPLL